MKIKLFLSNFRGFLAIILTLAIFLLPDYLAAKGSFGGSRSSGSRSFGGSRSSSSSKSFGGTRSSSSGSSVSIRSPTNFGGTAMTSSAARAKYGTPRQTTTMQGRNASGMPQNYVVHSYGGYSTGLMQGYLMGATPFLWSTPFHPAFYYSKPVYVENADGTIEVYPPEFSYTKLIFTIVIFLVIVYVIYVVIRNRRRATRSQNQSSFS